MLHCMHEEIGNTSAQSEHDFAGLLAALAAAKSTELPAWTEDELPQDAASLSYEGALRTHARYMPGDTGTEQVSTSQPEPVDVIARQDDHAARPQTERDRKCASITIRMSKAECERLHQRAAEAGLTVSAYLRSCTLEAEALRAQVKAALAELRSAHAPERKFEHHSEAHSVSGIKEPAQSPRQSWLRRIMPDPHPARNLAGA